MKLTRICIHGFKSFADKVSIDIKDGITGIVGPNGSGKSNIVDAIRWVLGEQSLKDIRGGNSCAQRLMYGPDPDLEVLYGPAPIDTTIRAMYGVPVDTTVEAPVVCKYGVNAPADWDEPGQEETK